MTHLNLTKICKIRKLSPRNNMEQDDAFNLNDSMFRTLGALGMPINNDVAKNEIRLRASKFAGMSIALSLTESNRRKRLICHFKFEMCGY